MWDQLDFKQLRRMWITDDGLDSKNRLRVALADIPVSDIPPGYQTGPDEEFDMEYVDGLAYAIPMRNDKFQGYNTDTIPGPQNRDNCGLFYRRYKGQLVNERNFTWHSKDDRTGTVKLPIRGARVEVWQYHRAAFDEHIATFYTDAQGYVSGYGGTTVQFEKCSSNSNDIQVYLKIKMTDGGENVRVKESWAFDRYVTTLTPLRTINYNSNQSVFSQITFGQPAAVGHEIELSEPQVGKVFTWAKIAWDYTRAALASSNKNLSTDVKIVLVGGNDVGHYLPFSQNIELGSNTRVSEFVVQHEFGHYVQHELQGNDTPSSGASEHSGQYNNNHYGRTLKEGFADGFAFIMDEMTFSVLDQEAGFGWVGVSYHDRITFGGSGFQNLTHPFVSELAFGSILLDLWDGPTNPSAYNNPRGAIRRVPK